MSERSEFMSAVDIAYIIFTIGADGMRSTVARLAGAPHTVLDPKLTCAYYSYWTDVPVTGLELFERAGGWVAALPTHDHATLVLTYFPQAHFRQVRADAGRAHLRRVHATAPELAERLLSGRQVERLRGTGDQRNYFRRAAGPGWALVGDAGHHKDSITARGITDAFTQAETLARHLGDRLADDPALLGEALRRYARDRDDALISGYRSTLDVARLAPPDDQRLALLRAVQDDPELTSIYFGVFAGIHATSALLTPRLIAAL